MHAKLNWPADIRPGRAIVLAALLAAVLLPTVGGATGATPGKDPREKAPPTQTHLNPQLVPGSNPRPVSGGKAAAVQARPEPGWRTGIIASGQAPFPGTLYRFQNQWHDVVQGQHVNVYAGALAQHPEQGILVVQTTPVQRGRPARAPEVIRAPGRTGPLHLVSAQNTSLHLASADARRFTFEVVSRELRPD